MPFVSVVLVSVFVLCSSLLLLVLLERQCRILGIEATDHIVELLFGLVDRKNLLVGHNTVNGGTAALACVGDVDNAARSPR